MEGSGREDELRQREDKQERKGQKVSQERSSLLQPMAHPLRQRKGTRFSEAW